MKCSSSFWVRWRNPVTWPFKWNLFSSSFAWYHFCSLILPFLAWFNFDLLLFFAMLKYDNKYQTKENQNWTKDKTELQPIHFTKRKFEIFLEFWDKGLKNTHSPFSGGLLTTCEYCWFEFVFLVLYDDGHCHFLAVQKHVNNMISTAPITPQTIPIITPEVLWLSEKACCSNGKEKKKTDTVKSMQLYWHTLTPFGCYTSTTINY